MRRERSTELGSIDLMLFADVRPNVCPAKTLVVDKHGTDRLELLILSVHDSLVWLDRYGRRWRAPGKLSVPLFLFTLHSLSNNSVVGESVFFLVGQRWRMSRSNLGLEMLIFAEACCNCPLNFKYFRILRLFKVTVLLICHCEYSYKVQYFVWR